MYKLLDKMTLGLVEGIDSSNKYIETEVNGKGVIGALKYIFYCPLFKFYILTFPLVSKIYKKYLDTANTVNGKVHKYIVIDRVLYNLEPKIKECLNVNMTTTVVCNELVEIIGEEVFKNSNIKDTIKENVFVSMIYLKDCDVLHAIINLENIPDGVNVVKIADGMLELIFKHFSLLDIGKPICDVEYKDFINNNRELFLNSLDSSVKSIKQFKEMNKINIDKDGIVTFTE